MLFFYATQLKYQDFVPTFYRHDTFFALWNFPFDIGRCK